MHEIVCVIPARLKSTRLPHKPLLNIVGKSMIERTFERASAVLPKEIIYVATDSELIFSECKKFTENVVMTTQNCLTGTDRIREFSEIIEAEVYINLQGDEPIMPLQNIKKIYDEALISRKDILNGYAPITQRYQYESRTVPKVVVSNSEKLMYMSRSPIPGGKTLDFQLGFKQICVYSFPRWVLERMADYKTKTTNENIEDIEILRFLENNHEIKMLEMSANTVAVDTQEDLNLVRMIIEAQGERLPEYDC
jgi:3-deoxy-manno-octulosonate cytidylyltransferase (CMP-KDO synthetase)